MLALDANQDNKRKMPQGKFPAKKREKRPTGRRRRTQLGIRVASAALGLSRSATVETRVMAGQTQAIDISLLVQ